MSDSEESEEEEESEDDYGHDEPALSRKRTVTQRRPGNQKYNSNTRSELGHGGGRDEDDDPTITHRSPRRRASHSTSALVPNAAAQRASTVINNMGVYFFYASLLICFLSDVRGFATIAPCQGSSLQTHGQRWYVNSIELE